MSVKRGSRFESTAPVVSKLFDQYVSRTHSDLLMIHGNSVSPAEVLAILREYVSEERMARIREVVASRTRSVVTVVEGAVNTGNVSAVMRTAEGLGFIDFHLITSGKAYRQSRRSSQGAEKWMDVTVWDSPVSCVQALRDGGYRVVTMSPDRNAVPIEAIDFTQRTAVVLGNELDGVSKELQQRSEIVARIALNGFVESYNVSVAAALTLYQAFRDRIERQGHQGDLSDQECEILTAAYCIRAVRQGDRIVAERLRRMKTQ